MKTADKHPQEELRLKSLNSLSILDTFPEKDFDELVEIASQICGTPAALISLVDEKRQWFKAKKGVSISETSRDIAFCSHAILKNEVLVVEDATKDPRFSDNPLVTGEYKIQFYAGAPLMSPDGFPIGTVCVIDSNPNKLTPIQISALAALSNQVTRLLELRSKIIQLQTVEAELTLKNAAYDQNQKDLRFILDSVPFLIGHWKSDLTNLKSNLPYEKYLGLKPDKIKGRTLGDILGQDLYEKNLPHIKKVLSGVPVQFERSFPDLSGKIIHAKVSYVPFFENNSVVSFLSVVADITEIKDLETERTRLQLKLAESARLSSLGEMAGGIAHEINNPLAILLGKIGVLKRKLELKSLEAKDFESLEKNIDRIAKIISNLRSFSRIAEEDNIESTSVNLIIQNTLSICGAKLKSENIEIKIICPESIKMECRPVQISQILMNLLFNARDAMGKKEDKWIQIEVKEESNFAIISVKDSGNGIDPQTAAKIMQPFFTTKNSGKGTGLGLSISNEIAESHNGKLAYAADQTNTTFVLTIPKHRLRNHKHTA